MIPRVDSYRFGFVMEQTLGHVSHYRNLRAAIDAEPDVRATWYPIAFAPQGRVEHLPLLRSNWSLRASWRVWRTLAPERANHLHDALFFHTQVSTLLCPPLMRRVPAVVSLDATPINYDAVGVAYGHKRSPVAVEEAKRRLHMRALGAASALVTWCAWARDSLITDYRIDASRVTVIPPGVNLGLWPRAAHRESHGITRVLFVGGDFVRKGGEVLLRACAGLGETCELHLVTKAAIEPGPGIFVYHDVEPNSELLRRLYATADIFVLPTLADCFPLVIQEAMVAGLPVITTDVGAIGEAVQGGVTGLLVPPDDVRALRAALDLLCGDRDRRRVMGVHGRKFAEHHFDSTANAKRIVHIMQTLVDVQGSPKGDSPGTAAKEPVPSQR